jgi:hypothetical protein
MDFSLFWADAGAIIFESPKRSNLYKFAFKSILTESKFVLYTKLHFDLLIPFECNLVLVPLAIFASWRGKIFFMTFTTVWDKFGAELRQNYPGNIFKAPSLNNTYKRGADVEESFFNHTGVLGNIMQYGLWF